MSRSMPALLMLAVSCLGCGSDFTGFNSDTTGFPASPLGQVVEFELLLPDLLIRDASRPGVTIEMRIEIERSGAGESRAYAVYERAHFDGRSAEVEDLTDGVTSVVLDGTSWAPGILGPLRIEGTLFNLMMNGTTQDGGWTIAGSVVETQSSGMGTFSGRRQQRFLIGETDFLSTTGVVTELIVRTNQPFEIRSTLELISSDAILRASGGGAFAVNRFTFDNIQRLDPRAEFATSWQRSSGGGSNPHDVLLHSASRGYATRYEPPFNDVWIFDPAGGNSLGSIPLESLAGNPDGTPRADRIVSAAGTLFVSLQDIDRSFTDYRSGKLAMIDPATDAVVGVLDLGGKNPGEIEVVRDDRGQQTLYVALAGIFPGLLSQELSGGVARIDPHDRVFTGLVLDDDDAGGNIGGLAMASDQLGYVIVSDENFVNRVLAFDPLSGDILRTVFETTDFIPEIEIDSRGLLAIPDRSFFEPKLCLYQTPLLPEDPEQLIGCAPTTLQPFSFEALD